MKKTLIYFSLQIKKAARFFPFVLLISLVLCIGLGLILGTAVKLDNQAENKQKIAIGVVGDAYESYLGFGITAIESLDSSRYSIELLEMNEQDAKKALSSGELEAYIVIPEGFIEALVHAEVRPIRYVTTSVSTDIATLFQEEMLEAISCMLIESQKGIYGMQDAAESMDTEGVSALTDRLNTEYFSLILGRSSLLEQEIVGVSDHLSFGGYMFCGIVILLMLLGGISCCPLFIKKDMALPKLLNAGRQGPFRQIAGEYASYYLMMLLNNLLLFGTAILAVGEVISIIPELQSLTISRFVEIVLGLLPALLTITAMQFLMYELTSGIVSGVLLQFLSAVCLGYISGCFYPISFFPKSIQILSDILPSGIARGYLSGVVSGQKVVAELFLLLGYFVLFFALTVLLRSRRIKKA